MAGKIAIYNLGQLGVDVVKSPVHIDDGAFTKAQNAQVDSVQGVGGIRKRDGIAKFNGSVLAGSVTGMIGLPLPDQSLLARTFYAPMDDHGGVATQGWRKSTTGTSWSNVATNSTPAVPASISTTLLTTAQTIGVPLTSMQWQALNNVLYYPSNDYTQGTDDPPIHVYDGTTDYKFLSVPDSVFRAGTRIGIITSIQPYDERTLMLSTYDDNNFGRVILLDIATGRLTTLGPQSDQSSFIAFPGQPVLFGGKVFYSTVNTGGGTVGKVFWARQGDAVWTRETAGDTTAGVGHNVGACVFKSNLYFGSVSEAATAAKIYQRSPSGVYTVKRTCGTAALGTVEGPFIVSADGTTMWCYENVSGGSTGTTTANLQRILETTDGTSYSQVYDIGANANNGYTYPGYPVLDANGDLYWPIINPQAAVPSYTGIILKRTSAGVWSIVENTNAHLRGQIMRIKF